MAWLSVIVTGHVTLTSLPAVRRFDARALTLLLTDLSRQITLDASIGKRRPICSKLHLQSICVVCVCVCVMSMCLSISVNFMFAQALIRAGLEHSVREPIASERRAFARALDVAGAFLPLLMCAMVQDILA